MDTRQDDPSSIIDTSQIQGLLEAAGRDGVDMILDAFWRSSDDLLAQIREAVANQNFGAVAALTHALKGSAANVGAGALAETARLLEVAIKNDDRDGLDRELNAIASSYEDTKRAFDAVLQAAA